MSYTTWEMNGDTLYRDFTEKISYRMKNKLVQGKELRRCKSVRFSIFNERNRKNNDLIEIDHSRLH